MESPSIKDLCTPLSLGGNLHQRRALWKRPIVRLTSTPISTESDRLPCHLRLDLELSTFSDQSYFEPNESPIFFVQQKLDLSSLPVFGRKLSLESDRLNSSSFISCLGKMELCENNNNNHSENFHNFENNKQTDTAEGSSSNFHASNELKKIKNKKKKSLSPKSKNPKLQKIGFGTRVINLEGMKKKPTGTNKLFSAIETTKKPKSPKSRSPKTYKIGPKRAPGLNTSVKKGKNTSKEKKTPGTSDNASASSNQPGSQCSGLKISKCARSPKLRTAERALVKQHRDKLRRENEKALEEYQKMLMEEQKRREEEEIQKLRQKTCFKANPVRKYAPLPRVKKRALTDPISPNLCKKRRIESSSQNSNSNRTE